MDTRSKSGLFRDRTIVSRSKFNYARCVACIFSSFAYIETYEITADRNYWHSIDPGSASTEYYGRSFDEYKKKELQPLFEKNGIFGEIYPVGAAYDDYMDIYYHENGKFYVYMNGGGPLTEIGSNVDEMLNYLLGDDISTRKDIVD